MTVNGGPPAFTRKDKKIRSNECYFFNQLALMTHILSKTGVLMSNLALGRIPDLVGRRIVTMWSHWILGFLTIMMGLANNIYLVHVLR